MINVRWLRTTEELLVVKQSELKRLNSCAAVDEALEADQRWRASQRAAEMCRAAVKTTQRAMRNQVTEENRAHLVALKREAAELGRTAAQDLEERNVLLARIGNVLHAKVPPGDHEQVVREEGPEPRADAPQCVRLAREAAAGVNFTAGTRVCGAGEYFLTGDAASLHRRISQAAQQLLAHKGYTAVVAPTWIRPEVARVVGHLQREAHLTQYLVDAQNSPLLVATSEQPMVALHAGERLSAQQLPIRYCAVSSCWRRESRGSGEGLFRVPRFEKVEQILLCEPHNAWARLEESIECALEFFTRVCGIRCRVVACPATDLQKGQSLKYDIQGWFADEGCFRELASCSCNSDYFSRALDIRYSGIDSVYNEGFVWIIASTMCAIQRTMACLYSKDESPEINDAVLRVNE